MRDINSPHLKASLFATAVFLTWSPMTSAAAIIFEHLPEANSDFVSHHTTGGPVLADDFDPAGAGVINQAEWWGTNPTSTEWELTLHFGQLGGGGFGEPAPIPATTGGRKYFVSAVGDDTDGDGIFQFSAALPGDFFVEQGPLPLGEEYWFSIANFDDGWTWALAGAGPTVGDEHWHAVVSTGDLCGDGGPHCGPWSEIEGIDFAFRLNAVPEPSAVSLLLLGALAAFGARRRKA